MTGPIKPSEVVAAKKTTIPEGVFEAFNELIVEHINGNSAVVKQLEVVNRILQKFDDCTEEEILDKGWLDVEDVYREAGWHVEFDKPGYNEMYGAFFTFRKGTK